EGIDHTLDAAELISADPPTAVRPVSITVATRDGVQERLASGAPEAVLAMDRTADAPTLAAWAAQVEAGAAEGERLIGLARAADGEQRQEIALGGVARSPQGGARGA